MSITALNNATIKLITSTQVITSVSSVVKELVENALDAGAKNIEVKLIDKGLSLIEVRDDGHGISKSNTEYMAQHHYTSKISNFHDLESLRSYGFRGEALASVCGVADVKITTRTSGDEAATSYTMDGEGRIAETEASCRSVGTTIQVKQLFKRFPVRRQVASNPRKATQDVKLIEFILRSFGICQPAVRISYRLDNNVVFAKPSVVGAKEALAYVIGKTVVSKLDLLEIEDNEVKLELMIPRKDLKDISIVCQTRQQYVYVNGRPVGYKQFEKVLNDRMSEHFDVQGKKKMPFYLNIAVAPSKVDVNLEPNKTNVILQNEGEILKILDEAIKRFYGISDENLPPISRTESSISDTSTGYQDYTQSINNAEVEWPACKKPRLENEKAIMVKDAQIAGVTKKNWATINELEKDRVEGMIVDPNESMTVNQSFESIEVDPPTVRRQSVMALERSDAFGSHSLEDRTEMLARDSIGRMFPAPILSECESNDSSNGESEKLMYQEKFDSFDNPQDTGSSQVRTTNDSEPFDDSPGNLSAPKNADNQRAPALGEIETLTQLPVVDLGEDFDMQPFLANFPKSVETSDEKNNDPVENIYGSYSSGTVYKPSLTDNNMRSGQNSEEGKVSKVGSDKITLGKDNVSIAMWSRGQVPGLQGRTDVSSYDNMKSSTGSNTNSNQGEPCKSYTGFSKFSAEIRPRMFKENPGIALSEVAKVMTDRWKELSPEERGYYRDLALEERTRTENERKAEKKAAVASNKEVGNNKKRMLKLLENMRKVRDAKSGDVNTRTTETWNINSTTITKHFLTKQAEIQRQSSTDLSIIGRLDRNFWTVGLNKKIWAVNVAKLLEDLCCDDVSLDEMYPALLAELLRRLWIVNKDDYSIMCELHDLPQSSDLLTMTQ